MEARYFYSINMFFKHVLLELAKLISGWQRYTTRGIIKACDSNDEREMKGRDRRNSTIYDIYERSQWI